MLPKGAVKICDTAQRGEAATKGARACDPPELCRPPSVSTNPARRSLSTCCGSQSRAPQNRRGPGRFGQILIERENCRGLCVLLPLLGGEGRGGRAFPHISLSQHEADFGAKNTSASLPRR